MLSSDVETAILTRVIAPEQGGLPTEAARQILNLGFTEADHARMVELSSRGQTGVLTPGERDELEGFINVGHLIALLQSKARMSLRNHGSTA
jgi:hypothetical protein